MRRYGDAIRRDLRYTFRPGVYAILPRGPRLLVTRQHRPRPELQLPGGGIDPGESPLRALHREVLEETGWHIAAPRRVAAFRRFAYMPEYDLWAEKLCTIYLARPVRRRAPPSEPGHDAFWIDAAAATDALANPGERSVLSTILTRHRPNS